MNNFPVEKSALRSKPNFHGLKVSFIFLSVRANRNRKWCSSDRLVLDSSIFKERSLNNAVCEIIAINK